MITIFNKLKQASPVLLMLKSWNYFYQEGSLVVGDSVSCDTAKFVSAIHKNVKRIQNSYEVTCFNMHIYSLNHHNIIQK